MRGITFPTGRFGSHQEAMIAWARRRLADRGGGHIELRDSRIIRWRQHGVLIADGVGMGKTWEALGAAAVILATKIRHRRDGGQRITDRHRLGRVLVITPPNLVDKWADEINRNHRDRFYGYLKSWAATHPKRQFILRTLSSADSARFVRQLPSRADLELGGTYVVNHRLFGRRPASAAMRRLRELDWDLVIIDEAHHAEARAIIKKEELDCLKYHRAPVILLSATPFELSFSELRPLVNHLGHGEGPLMSARPVKDYHQAIKSLEARSGLPATAAARSLSAFFRQFMARNRPNPRFSASRHYHFLTSAGTLVKGPLAPDAQDLAALPDQGGITPSPIFERWYFAERLRLKGQTSAAAPTCIANSLRQLLSTPGQAARSARTGPPPSSPRLDALCSWYRGEAVRCLQRAMDDGKPRKTLIFTNFVNPAAEDLRRAMSQIWTQAVADVAAQHPAWQSASVKALNALEKPLHQVLADWRMCDRFAAAIKELRRKAESGCATGTLLLLSRPIFFRAFRRELTTAAEAAQQGTNRVLASWGLSDPDSVDEHQVGNAKRVIRTQQRDLHWLLSWLGDHQGTVRYDGHLSGRERNRVAFGFQSRIGPWVLIASRVASEGIDLHPWARHLVHFDLDWNPAVMEQREGRCDRIGRRLREQLDVLFLVVRGTYDERMLHQVAVRQQLHRLILGINRSPLRAEGDLPESLIAHADHLTEMELDLRPGLDGR